MSFKQNYWKFSLIAIVVLLGVILFYEFRPFLGGILGAFTIYALVRGQMIYLTEKRRWNASLVSLLLLFEVILIFLIPLSLAVWLFIIEIQNFNLDTAELVSQIEHVAALIKEKTNYNVLDRANISSAVALVPKITQMLMSGITGFTINVIILILVLYFMLVSGRSMEKYFYDILPFREHNKKEVAYEMNILVKSNAIGVPLLAVIQGLVALVGYIIFGAPSPVVMAFLTCFASVIPLVGTGLIWFPLSLYLGISGDWWNALGLAAFSLIILTNIDNLIRFVLQKKLADTHPLITIFGVIIGISLFGFMGIIFGPILLAVFLLCFNIFKSEYVDGKPYKGTFEDAMRVKNNETKSFIETQD